MITKPFKNKLGFRNDNNNADPFGRFIKYFGVLGVFIFAFPLNSNAQNASKKNRT